MEGTLKEWEDNLQDQLQKEKDKFAIACMKQLNNIGYQIFGVSFSDKTVLEIFEEYKIKYNQ